MSESCISGKPRWRGIAVGGLILAGLASATASAATTTYTSVYAGGTISPGDTVLLNNGASVTGDITANGTLQFNQDAGNNLTISNLISGSGTLSLTNTGTLNLTGTSVAFGTVVLNMNTSASRAASDWGRRLRSRGRQHWHRHANRQRRQRHQRS
jgi:hypothetical protein